MATYPLAFNIKDHLDAMKDGPVVVYLTEEGAEDVIELKRTGPSGTAHRNIQKALVDYRERQQEAK
jgi:hypothetical protein